MIKRISASTALVLYLAFTLLGQDPASAQDVEKAKAERRAKLIEALTADVNQLKLPENHAFVSVKIGTVLWKHDPERATALFKKAVDALIAAQAIAEANKNPNHQNYDLLQGQSLRPLVLNTIATSDAGLALDAFYRTRPAAIQKALASGKPSGKISNSGANATHLSHQEIALEQRLLRMAAEQKPERALAILKESIRKHLSSETLAMLKKVWEKDPALGKELADEVVSRLASKPFVDTHNRVNDELINLSNSILAEHMRERSPNDRDIAFDDGRIRSLAVNLISFYVEHHSLMGHVPIQQLEPIARRYHPASIDRLKKVNEFPVLRGRHIYVDPKYTELMNSNPTADVLISAAKKFPSEQRRPIYTNAANMLSEAGQYERAVALLNDNFEDDALESAMSSLNWSYTHQLINRREFDAAESLIMQLNDNNRVQGLNSLATSIYQADPDKNRSRAMAVLQRARSLLPDRPGNSNELSQMFELINTLATIEPAEAFRNLETLIDQINQLTEAWAVVNGFQGGGYIRQGEYLMSSGSNFGIYINQNIYRTLALSDFGRTTAMIETFSRREMRIVTMLWLLESGL